MNYRCGKISRLLVACSFFFVLSGKPLSSFATGPSSQAGMGSIPYSGVWTNTSTPAAVLDRGSFSPPTNNGNAFYYVQTSTLNDNGGSPGGNGSNDINTRAVSAWGMTALNSTLANATRPFPAALTNSQTFQIDMDNGNIAAGAASVCPAEQLHPERLAVLFHGRFQYVHDRRRERQWSGAAELYPRRQCG